MRTWLEAAFEWRAVRWLASLAFLMRALTFRLCGLRYRAISDFCWLARVPRVKPFEQIGRAAIDRLIESARERGRNPLVDWYQASSLSRRRAAAYLLRDSGRKDLFRDLIVLKPATGNEKGVILLKYVQSFEAAAALLDVRRLFDRYSFVLEPCWAGYSDPALLMYFTPGHPVVVQCFTEDDHSFIESIGEPFVPARLGPADWVNVDIFREESPLSKTTDLVMVANWGAHKRHAQLFRALRAIGNRDIRVLLVGFPWAGRTAADIRREAKAIAGDSARIEILESVSQLELARILARCKVFVYLSRKEGDNKSLVEAMFAGVPAIIHDRTIGGARGRVNSQTGVFSSDDELPDQIRYMLAHHAEFQPRSWAMAHTGSAIASAAINTVLTRVAHAAGQPYTRGIVEKVNSPNLAYRDTSNRDRFRADYDFIDSCKLRCSAG